MYGALFIRRLPHWTGRPGVAAVCSIVRWRAWLAGELIPIKVDNATLEALKGALVKDLPLKLAFRFWVVNPYSGLFIDPLAKVWFEREPDDVIWVDFDASEGRPRVAGLLRAGYGPWGPGLDHCGPACQLLC
jgi:hypothetical protein